MDEMNKLLDYVLECMKRGENGMDGPYFHRAERSADGSTLEIDLYVEDGKSASIKLNIESIKLTDEGYMN